MKHNQMIAVGASPDDDLCQIKSKNLIPCVANIPKLMNQPILFDCFPFQFGPNKCSEMFRNVQMKYKKESEIHVHTI